MYTACLPSTQFLPDVGLCECAAVQASAFCAEVNNLAMILTADCFQRANGVVKIHRLLLMLLKNQLRALKRIFFFVFCLFFLGLHPWHVEVPSLEVELELQLLAYVRATETRVMFAIYTTAHSNAGSLTH